ncbi:MAG: LysR family transcriptional regulator [Proteobacteria bacterium]|nr:LysR family transcriptional regulator [Pseudomonadota bacterium]
MPINELRSISTFARAVELGSIRRAAVAQGVTPQAASQAIAQLERHLGVRLLHRTTRGLSLTDEGQQFLEATQPAVAMLERALHAVRGAKDEVAGPLRIVGPRSAFAPVLMPIVDEFCRSFPLVLPDVQLDDGIGNWVQDRVDVGFRIGGPPAEGLIARRLFAMQLLICAAPDYLKQFGAPRSLDELAAHRCSVFRHPATGQVMPWHVRVGEEVVHRPVAGALSTNDVDAELQAILDGTVIGQVSGMQAAPLVRAGKLVPVLAEHATDHLGLYLYYGNRAAQPRRVRAFIDLAIQRLAGNPSYVLSPKELAAAQTRRTGRSSRG